MRFESYKGRTINHSKPVRVYRNLNKPGVVYSIQQSGKVVGYATDVTLSQCSCYVNETARQRVVANKCREVHAWIEGYITDTAVKPAAQFSYNPYKHTGFYIVSTGATVTGAGYMQFNGTGAFISVILNP